MLFCTPFDLFGILAAKEDFFELDSDDELIELLPWPQVRRTDAYRRYIKLALDSPDAEIHGKSTSEGGIFRSSFCVPYSVFK